MSDRDDMDDTQPYPVAPPPPDVHPHDRLSIAPDVGPEAIDPEQARRDRFGGMNWGAGFFGWLVAMAVIVLLVGAIGGVAAATGVDEDVLPTATVAEVGLTAIVTLGVVLMVGYYAGGYVAGRMSRYDGGRQGLGVWLIGLLATAATLAAGAVLGTEYDLLRRADLRSVPLSVEEMTRGGVVVAAALLIGTLRAAWAGGGVGCHYHARVDRAGY
jgi:hypothetical protein